MAESCPTGSGSHLLGQNTPFSSLSRVYYHSSLRSSHIPVSVPPFVSPDHQSASDSSSSTDLQTNGSTQRFRSYPISLRRPSAPPRRSNDQPHVIPNVLRTIFTPNLATPASGTLHVIRRRGTRSPRLEVSCTPSSPATHATPLTL